MPRDLFRQTPLKGTMFTYYFKLASDDITEPDNILAAVIAKEVLPRSRVVLTGHACDTPIVSERSLARWGTNQKLSEARAATVRQALVDAGVDPTQIVTVHGYGDTKPASLTDKNLNRKVDVTFLV